MIEALSANYHLPTDFNSYLKVLKHNSLSFVSLRKSESIDFPCSSRISVLPCKMILPSLGK